MMCKREPKRTCPARLYAIVFTRDLEGLDDIYCIAVDTDGTQFVCTESALYAFSPN